MAKYPDMIIAMLWDFGEHIEPPVKYSHGKDIKKMMKSFIMGNEKH